MFLFSETSCVMWKKISNFWQPLLINWRPTYTVLVAAILASFQLAHRFIVSSGLQYYFKVALLLIKKIQSKNIFINRKMISTFFLFLILIISSSLQFWIPFQICHHNEIIFQSICHLNKEKHPINLCQQNRFKKKNSPNFIFNLSLYFDQEYSSNNGQKYLWSVSEWTIFCAIYL